jgi:hypothetical protein
VKRLALIFLALLAIAIVGCGSSSGDDQGSGGGGDGTASEVSSSEQGDDGGPTQAEFVAQGDAVCKKIGKELITQAERANQAGGIGHKNGPTKEFREEVVENTILPFQQKEVDALRKLELPAGDEEAVTAMLDAWEAAIVAGKKKPTLLFEPGKPPFGEVGEELGQYGFKVCGSSF